MKTCETCRHWKKPSWRDTVGNEALCGKILTFDADKEPFDKISDSENGENIWTGKNFGCIHHEEKDVLVNNASPNPPPLTPQ